MAERITLTYDNKKYELGYTRESVKQMENTGFNVREFVSGAKPLTMNLLLFNGAFLAQNKKVKRKTIEEIYDHLPNKNEVLTALAEMYGDTLESLSDGVDDGKNVIVEIL